MFIVEKSSSSARVGKLCIKDKVLSTPLLFPVVSMITGTTPKGGGILKYVLQANENGLLRRDLPVMTQVLHFLNFISGNSASLEKWRDIGIRERYNTEVDQALGDHSDLQYSAPIFFDSGGFQLLGREQLDLSQYGLLIDKENGWKTILELQMDLGKDNSIFATLDYPLSLKLSGSQARKRMVWSRKNAVQTAIYLQNLAKQTSFLYVAAHGQDSLSMKNYVQSVFKEFKENGLSKYPFGLAIGSLVPLRGAKKDQLIVDLVLGLQKGIPNEYRRQVPIHVFGVTGNLIPILAYLGVDSFDSSTYIQEARGYSFIDPDTKVSKSILGLERITCNCLICKERIRKGIDLKKIQDSLTAKTKYSGAPLSDGTYKSEYYGYIALHNLEIDFEVVKQTRQAIEADCIQEYLIEHIQNAPRLKSALEAVAQSDLQLKQKLNRKNILIESPKKITANNQSIVQNKIDSNYTVDSFNILSNGYAPPTFKRALLILPCSIDKPYSSSHSHRFIQGRLDQNLGEKVNLVHKVTLSGLYGPVPEEYESKPQILNYDFRLDVFDKKQIDFVSDRLLKYIQRFESNYDFFVGYVTSKAYRVVLEKVAKETPLVLLPKHPKVRRLTEMFRNENISELVCYLLKVLEE